MVMEQAHGLLIAEFVTKHVKSDFTFESTESQVPELHHWLADLRSLAAYCRSSNIREEDIWLQAQILGREQ